VKKLLSVLLVLSLTLSLSLFSCEKKSDNNKNDDSKEEPTRELTAEEKAIMDEVISIMEDDTYDTNSVIDWFCGDFMVDGIQSQTMDINRIYKIGDVLAVEKTNGETTYQTVRNSKLYTINRTNDGTKLNLENTQDYPYDYPLGIFTAFGIDMSAVYVSDEATDKEPKVSYDSLEVSKDKKSVTFTKEYLDDLAKYVCSSLDAKEKEMNKFLKNMTASGEFTLKDQTAKINIEGNIKSVGDIKIEMCLTFKDSRPSYSASSISLTTESEGVPVTTTVEQELDHFVFNTDYTALIGFDANVTTTTESEATQNGVVLKYTNSVKNTYKFFSGPRANLDIEIVATQLVSAGGQTQASTSDITLSYNSSSCWYKIRANKEYISGLNALSASFGTPQNVTIPEDIYTVLPK